MRAWATQNADPYGGVEQPRQKKAVWLGDSGKCGEK